MTRSILREENHKELFMAMELSNDKWKLGFSDGTTSLRERTVSAGDIAAVVREIASGRSRYKLGEDAKVISCYEAGRDGFWIHRELSRAGIENYVVDPGSVEVNQRGRRKKTDRVDLRKLMVNLIRYRHGEEETWSVVRVPSEDEEDKRRASRELSRLKKERGSHVVRMKSLLVLHGIRVKSFSPGVDLFKVLRLRDGRPLPGHLMDELGREYARYELIEKQIKAVEEKRREKEKLCNTVHAVKARKLMLLRGVETGARVLVDELFGWRTFNNRRELAALVGLAPTPHQSGQMDRDLGISKCGNPQIRSLMVELSWSWLRYQPGSALSKWFEERFGRGRSRSRRVGIVALARKLLIAFWRFVEQDLVPEGALLKEAA